MNLISIVRTVAVCGAFMGAAAGLDLNTLQPIGSVAKVERSEGGVLISCQDGSQVQIEVLAPDLVRVRAGFRGAAPDLHSWAVVKSSWPASDWTLKEGPKDLRLRTAAVEVVINRAPLTISFVNPETQQVLNADYKAMSFDTKSPGFAIWKKLGFEEHFYGLGEKAAPLDKRRGRFTMWNSDTYGYTEGSDPLYQSIPFYMGWQDGAAYGLFYDNSFRSSFDFGSMSEEFTVYSADGGPLRYYFFAGPSMKTILERYTELTGRMPLHPKWALGHQQSRYSYYPESEVMQVAETYRKQDLPLDAIHLDINYMNGYRDFTWDPEKFPDPKGMIAALGRLGVKIVTIVDPGIKYQPAKGEAAAARNDPELGAQDQSYYVFNEGLKNDYFLRRANGQLYIGKVWPGEAVFVDYTKPAAAQWWGQMLRAYTDNGVAGIWTDMNEPSDFVDQTGASQMDVRDYDEGRMSPYAGNRNLFALEMAKATYEGLKSLRPTQRPYVITRAGFAGIQRYATMWCGDNRATWDSLALSLPMFESLALSGESFVGADVGGFVGRSNAQLLTRWYEASLLTPFLRNHAEMGSYDHEPWRFGTYYEDIIRKYLKLRYRLLPYLYTLIEESHRTGLPVLRPLLLEFQNDSNTLNIEDEFMIGSRLLLAPVVKPDEDARLVYLPAGTWYDFWTGQRMEGGRMLKVEAPLDKLPLFVRGGTILPLGPEMNYTAEKPCDPLTLVVYADAGGSARGSLYEDDGRSFAYETGAFRRTEIHAERDRVKLEESGQYNVPQRKIVIRRASPSSSARAEVVDDGQAKVLRLP